MMSEQLAHEAIYAYLTQFLGLGIVFFGGLWIAFKQGDVGFNTPRSRRWLAILVGGYVLYAVLQGVFQFSHLGM